MHRSTSRFVWGQPLGRSLRTSGAYAARSEARHKLRPTKRIADAIVALLVTQILLLGAEALALIDRISIVERVRAGHP